MGSDDAHHDDDDDDDRDDGGDDDSIVDDDVSVSLSIGSRVNRWFPLIKQQKHLGNTSRTHVQRN